MARLIGFLKIRYLKYLVILVVLIGCSYSDSERLYLDELNRKYKSFDFKLSDRLTNLELTINTRETDLDSIQLVNLFKDLDNSQANYQGVSWVYLIVENNNGYIISIGSDPRGNLYFFKGHEGNKKPSRNP
jgi:hypothetical protein